MIKINRLDSKGHNLQIIKSSSCRSKFSEGMCFKNANCKTICRCPSGYSQVFYLNEMACGFFAEGQFDKKLKKYLERNNKKCDYISKIQCEELSFFLNNLTEYDENENCLHEIIHMIRDLDLLNIDYISNSNHISSITNGYSEIIKNMSYFINSYNNHKDVIDNRIKESNCFFPLEKEIAVLYIRNENRKKALAYIIDKINYVFNDTFDDYEKMSKKEKNFRLFFASHFLLMNSRIFANNTLNNDADFKADYHVRYSYLNQFIEVMKTVASYDSVEIVSRAEEVWPYATKNYKISILFVVSLYILIENAKKYASGKRKIFISRKINQDTIELKISNETNDIGLENLNILFERGAQGKNHIKKEGNGLGLYIVKSMMLSIGGKIEIELSKEKTIFIVKMATNLIK